MAVCITRAHASQWPRRATQVALFLVSTAIFMTFFASTEARGQATTPPRLAPGARGDDKAARPAKGPENPLTLSQAVDRFLKENLELRAMRDEISMAQADIEAAAGPPQEHLLIEVGPNGSGESA
jgi:hypothetical protein